MSDNALLIAVVAAACGYYAIRDVADAWARRAEAKHRVEVAPDPEETDQ